MDINTAPEQFSSDKHSPWKCPDGFSVAIRSREHPLDDGCSTNQVNRKASEKTMFKMNEASGMGWNGLLLGPGPKSEPTKSTKPPT